MILKAVAWNFRNNTEMSIEMVITSKWIVTDWTILQMQTGHDGDPDKTRITITRQATQLEEGSISRKCKTFDGKFKSEIWNHKTNVWNQINR